MEVDVHDQLSGGSRAVLALSGAASSAGARARPLAAWLAGAGVALGSALVAPSAGAMTLDVPHDEPSLVGEPHVFTATVTDAVEPVTYEWRFGEDQDYEAGGAEMAHTFSASGLYSVDVVATDATGYTASAYFRYLAHYPLTSQKPSSSSSIVYDSSRRRVYSVNEDNDTLTAIDGDNLVKLGELDVYRKPVSLALAPDGKLWVVHQDDYAIAVVDPGALAIERGFRLPYASQPVGLAMSPTGDAAYVSLAALGKLLKLDPSSGAVLGEVLVGPSPRGIAVSYDGKDVYVTRFISPSTGGEVVKVDATTMTVATRIVLALDTETVDGDQKARGLPNYLFSVALSPDGRQAWVPGKKDNILRGRLLDGQELTHDTMVRPLAAVIDTGSAQEILANRVDLDDRSQPVHVEFTPEGNFAVLSLGGSNRIEVRDLTRPTQVFSAIGDVGAFPRAAVLAPDARLFVQSALSREVRVYDLSALLHDFDQATPPELAVIPAVAHEKLSPDVLLGKKVFHDAEDPRMALEGYLSCGACHFEGMDDGRTFDFSTRGEGLRNTISLIGHEGTGQGRLNWTATLDEVQDFEHQIRELFGGVGFLPDELFHVGTRDQPLGDPKVGLSPELDALAAYVTSLDRVDPSPYRQSDGSLTPEGEAGKVLFGKLGCDFCHAGPAFTDSARGVVHDVGTLTAASGMHAGGPLLGLDTPTLLGVWETAPYLHDGSAPTLRDVLTTKNPTDLHGYVSSLAPAEIDALVAYVQQIDGETGVHRLPFDPPPADDSGGAAGSAGGVAGHAGGTGTAGAGGSSGGAAGYSGGGAAGYPAGGGAPPASNGSDKPPTSSGCTCGVPGRAQRGPLGALAAIAPAAALFGMLLVRRWRGRPAARLARRLVLGSLALLGAGCGAPEAERHATPPNPPAVAGAAGASALPAVTHPDPELVPLGTRAETIARVCGRGHGDSFAKVLCDGGGPPVLQGLSELLDRVGLGTQRAFALTGNSTSLVSLSVSALNPRILVFPPVSDDLRPPDTMTAVGFVRGEPFVELVSRDPVANDLNFYLLVFEQACSYASGGCDLASLLTDALERDWTTYSVYDQSDLEQTSFDCLSCHQPGGAGTKRILRMQELASPWMHWFPQRFVQRTESDRVLLAEFAAAHDADATYGGIPVPVITGALDEGSGAQLEALVRAEGFGDQPNPFDPLIAQEIQSGASPTWQARFDAHLRGEAIAVPYPLIDVTDEATRTAATRSYQDVVRGVAPRESLLDIRQVFSADAEQKLSFVPLPGADGKTVLLEMCARCHDGRGNPALSKNAFNVRMLDAMPRAVKDMAIARIQASDVTAMPPWRVGKLTPEAIEAATLELGK